MKAEYARQLTQKSLQGQAIKRFVDVVNRRIKAAAEEGKSSIRDPHIGSAEDGFEYWLGGAEKEALRKHYEHNGFNWADISDPDPGHPCSGAYVELKW